MTIRSFVIRQGRMTDGQQRAFTEHWTTYGVDKTSDMVVSSQALFGDERELVLEIGFGNGESLIEMACQAPDKGFVGIEVHRPGVGHAILKAKERECDNIRFITHDAVEILREHTPAQSLARVQIYFPDPWPKLRHHKRRLIQKPFTQLVHSALAEGGELHMATDWQAYAIWMLEVMQQDSELWHNLGDESGFAPRPWWRPKTKFEARGERKGHGVWDLRYAKRSA